MSSSNQLAKQYQKKTDREHVLDNPGTYIGSTEKEKYEQWLLNESGKMQSCEIEMVPGLYKLFDEGIVNCRDHYIRMLNINPVTYIHIEFGDDGIITMTNDGDGIDVALHPVYNIYIPEMIFGELRTSTNYSKDEKRIVGGQNGFGFKLVLIWSTWGKIETVDGKRKLKYEQEFSNNLSEKSQPIISKYTKKSYTKISFKPDYERMGINGLTKEMQKILKRRVYDVAAVTDKKCKVRLNNEDIPIRNFTQYVDLYLGPKNEVTRVYEQSNERWEFIVAQSPKHEFMQVSFVNGIFTSKGGKHIDHILSLMLKKLSAYIKLKKKIDVKPSALKEQLILFVNCTIENPSFDSQTKDCLNTPVVKFGSSASISDKTIEKIASKSGLGVMDIAVSISQVKDTSSAKKTDGCMSKSIRGIPKLVDANKAGTKDSNKCTLILCEGDSAKAGVISGLSKADRDYYGIYPLKGKLMNVRDESIKKVFENKEIQEIKKIMGLESGKIYTQDEIQKKLRYSKIVFMTDQDLDGSHIKGLGINMFESLWNSLIQQPEFLGFMNTPIIKAKKGKTEKLFYNDGEYKKWKQTEDSKGWSVKYYKGLGTSTASEFKEYFEQKKIVSFNYDESSNNKLDMVFNKKRANCRKDWLSRYNRESFLDTNRDIVSYDEFIDKEMIHFSKYDNDRSIPRLDGFKLSQRKIIFSAFKKKLFKEIKVAQFSGYVSEVSAYHHGEASLNGAIVGMAQDYVGSNNINLLLPKGQFGTRLQGGKDSASERYIFTELNKITRLLIPELDDKVLNYMDDDGLQVEPMNYVPILPIILINGTKGIGTGFSTDIPCFNPKDLLIHIRYRLRNKDINKLPELIPWYRNFKGTITKVEDKKYMCSGCYEKINDLTFRITELPVGVWTDDYKNFLESLIDGKKGKVKDYQDNSTQSEVNIIIYLIKPVKDIPKEFKLTNHKSISNMHVFDKNDQLKKYDTVNEIIDEFFEMRLELYQTRKLYQLNNMKDILIMISNKVKYIEAILNDLLDLRKKSKNQIEEDLNSFGLIKLDESYHYLIKMPMDSVSQENIDKLKKEEKDLKENILLLESTSIEQIWEQELKDLEVFL